MQSSVVTGKDGSQLMCKLRLNDIATRWPGSVHGNTIFNAMRIESMI